MMDVFQYDDGTVNNMHHIQWAAEETPSQELSRREDEKEIKEFDIGQAKNIILRDGELDNLKKIANSLFHEDGGGYTVLDIFNLAEKWIEKYNKENGHALKCFNGAQAMEELRKGNCVQQFNEKFEFIIPLTVPMKCYPKNEQCLKGFLWILQEKNGSLASVIPLDSKWIESIEKNPESIWIPAFTSYYYGGVGGKQVKKKDLKLYNLESEDIQLGENNFIFPIEPKKGTKGQQMRSEENNFIFPIEGFITEYGELNGWAELVRNEAGYVIEGYPVKPYLNPNGGKIPVWHYT